MKKYIFLVLATSIIITASAFASQTAKANATEHFKKSSKAVQLAKSSRIPCGIWFDPVKWQITKNYNNDAEISFGLKGKDAYAYMINEGITAPIDILTNFVVGGLMDISEDFSIIEVEDRIVNGLPVKYLRVDALISGININYMIYLYCGKDELVQIYAYSFGKHFQDLEDFLNGFSKVK